VFNKDIDDLKSDTQPHTLQGGCATPTLRASKAHVENALQALQQGDVYSSEGGNAKVNSMIQALREAAVGIQKLEATHKKEKGALSSLRKLHGTLEQEYLSLREQFEHLEKDHSRLLQEKVTLEARQYFLQQQHSRLVSECISLQAKSLCSTESALEAEARVKLHFDEVKTVLVNCLAEHFVTMKEEVVKLNPEPTGSGGGEDVSVAHPCSTGSSLLSRTNALFDSLKGEEEATAVSPDGAEGKGNSAVPGATRSNADGDEESSRDLAASELLPPTLIPTVHPVAMLAVDSYPTSPPDLGAMFEGADTSNTAVLEMREELEHAREEAWATIELCQTSNIKISKRCEALKTEMTAVAGELKRLNVALAFKARNIGCTPAGDFASQAMRLFLCIPFLFFPPFQGLHLCLIALTAKTG
jgi:hypothetical protein